MEGMVVSSWSLSIGGNWGRVSDWSKSLKEDMSPGPRDREPRGYGSLRNAGGRKISSHVSIRGIFIS